MPMLRLALAVGLVVFGAIAVYMGGIVTIHALTSGRITMTYGTGAETIVKSYDRAIDAAGFWRATGLAGFLPLTLGLLAVWAGRRRLKA